MKEAKIMRKGILIGIGILIILLALAGTGSAKYVGADYSGSIAHIVIQQVHLH